MPNWIEGTMKLRGKQKDIMRFLDIEIIANGSGGDISDYVDRNIRDGFVEYEFKNDPHVNGTRRMFVDESYIYMDKEDECVCLDIRQAWCFSFSPKSDDEDLRLWADFAKKYSIDIKLFGIECGMCFTQEVIALRNERVISNVKYYEDWDWDCPFPNMGGSRNEIYRNLYCGYYRIITR